MTLANMFLLGLLCCCAIWLLEEAAQAVVPAAQSLGPLPADQMQDTDEYLSTAVPTLVRTWGYRELSSKTETPFSEDVLGTSQFDDYVPFAETGEYEPPGALDGSLSTLGDELRSLLAGENWSDSTDNLYFGVGALARLAPLNAGVRAGGLTQEVGPLVLDIYSITFAGLYADLSQPYARVSDQAGFLAAISLQGALKLELGESFFLGVGFTVYYLPTVNRVGFYTLEGADLATTSASVLYRAEAGGWNFLVGDRFRVGFGLENLMPSYDAGAVDAVDQYRFGRPQELGSRAFYAGEPSFFNEVGASASTQLDEYWQFRAFANNSNYWTASSLGPPNTLVNGGAILSYNTPEDWLRPWARYDYYEYADLKQQYHVIRAGLNVSVTPSFKVYALAGAALPQGGNGETTGDSFLWELGAVHHINAELSHSLVGGHNYFVTDYGDAFVGTYVRYAVSWRPLGSRLSLSGGIQEERNDYNGIEGLGYGARATLALTELTGLNFFAADGQYTRQSARYNRSVAGAGLRHSFTPSIYGNLSYQYSRYRSPTPASDFDEQLFLLSLTKTF